MPAVETWTVRRLLEWTTGFFTRKELDSPRLSAEMLLAHTLNYPRIKLYTDYERPLADAELASFRSLVQRAGEQEPIEYLTGTAHFFNLEITVTRDTLIPRPDTETLVENVLQLARNVPGFEAPRVLDLCTGTGCVAAAIAHHLKSATLVATDISSTAIAVARDNINRLNLSDRITLEQGDLFEPLSRLIDKGPFDLIVSNPPYIATPQLEQLDRSVKDYEPHLALDGGPDGLDLHRRILNSAHDRLRPQGRLFLEIAFDQGPLAKELAETYPNFEDPRILKDHAGNDRVLTATRK